MTSSVQPPPPAEIPAAGAAGAPRRLLTERQKAVLTALAAGFISDAAARRLGMSSRTARRVATAAASRLGATTPMQAIAVAAAAGELDMDAVRERRLTPWRSEAGVSTRSEAAAARRVRYAELRAAGLGLVEAAAVLGVTPETCRNYEAWAAEERCGGG